ncbi:glycosyltransferase [Vibrio fluvialis]|uniref:glycosyltransferase n=1 Tax=Vibrio fluvialis TaxID=676 RepID=UPI00192C1918|nr:glycosyltransferase [Vibrio fluvialis]MBL4305213.1 glycosyltransferase [Vibrio fluvialis]
MNILYVTTCLGPGGAQIQICNLADNMKNKGHNVMIVSLRDDITIVPETDVDVISLGLEKNIYSFINCLVKLKKIIKNFNPDIVHSHMIHANFFTRISKLFSKINCLINTAHSSNEGGSAMMRFYGMTDKLCDLTTNVSREAVNIYIEKKASFKGKIICHYNGIDTRKFSRTNSDYFHETYKLPFGSKVLLAIGRLTEAKDYPNLLKAFETLNDPSAYLFIVGEGELEAELKHLSSENIYSENIYFLGSRKDIPLLLSSCDTFVLSSKWEGFGLVVAEAMSCECNVVATDCGGVREVLGKHGILVESMNTSLLGLALKKSLSLKKGSNEKGRKHVVGNFDINVIADMWEQTYVTRMKN